MMLLSAFMLLTIGFVWGLLASFQITKSIVKTNVFWDTLYRDQKLRHHVTHRFLGAKVRVDNE